MDLVPMVVREVGTDPWGRPMVILADRENRRFLPIWIGAWEAWSIAVRLQGSPVARPLTHDLLADVLKRLGVTLDRVVVNDFRDSTYYAILTLRENGRVREVDARPSDAIALAVRTGADVFVAKRVLDQAAVESGSYDDSEERLETFKRLMEKLDIEDVEGQ